MYTSKSEIVNNRMYNPFLNHSINKKFIKRMLKEAGTKKRESFLGSFIFKNPKKYIHANCPFASIYCKNDKEFCYNNIEKAKGYFCGYLNTFMHDQSPLANRFPA